MVHLKVFFASFWKQSLFFYDWCLTEKVPFIMLNSKTRPICWYIYSENILINSWKILFSIIIWILEKLSARLFCSTYFIKLFTKIMKFMAPGEKVKMYSFWEMLNAQLWCPWSPLIIVKFMSPGSVVQALRQGQYCHIVKMNWILNLQLNGWLWCPWTLPLKLGNSWPLSQGLGHVDRANMTT